MVNFHSLHVHILTDKCLLCSSDKKKQICFIHQLCTEMPRLSENQRNQAIGMLQAGAMLNDIAQDFGCPRQTIHNLNTRFAITFRPRSSASWPTSLTSQQDDRYIMLTHLRNPFLPATATARQLGVNAQTIQNHLRQNNIPILARRAYTGPILTARHRAARLLWAQRHLHGTCSQWHNVIFSDKSQFSVSHANGRVCVYQRRNERYAQCCIREWDRFGGWSVMVWGGIMGNIKTDLVVEQANLNAQRYVNFLNNNLLPFMQNFGPGLTFQHDNARPHTALVTANFLAENKVNVLPWPALSPDMNPIKHIWDELGRRAGTNHQINNVQLEWQALPNVLIRRYVNSMRRRIRACIASNGSHTHY